eukprot:COSAG01_NODE_16892_length_1195_cov_18.305657_1_plen_153_part_10
MRRSGMLLCIAQDYLGAGGNNRGRAEAVRSAPASCWLFRLLAGWLLARPSAPAVPAARPLPDLPLCQKPGCCVAARTAGRSCLRPSSDTVGVRHRRALMWRRGSCCGALPLACCVLGLLGGVADGRRSRQPHKRQAAGRLEDPAEMLTLADAQ